MKHLRNARLLKSSTGLVALGLSLLAAATPAQAAVTVSTGQTQNMSCGAGLCTPTAADAVLNVTDLENYLAAGNLEVTTTGSGVDAEDIDVETAVTWSNASALSLVATHAIQIDQSVSVTGAGGLSLANDGQNESLAFGSSGNVGFSNLSSSLMINGASYTLVNTVKGLASAIANNANGNYAFANSFDAQGDGKYKQPPINTSFYGIFDGLGNTISNLTVASYDAGLFGGIPSGTVLRNLRLSHVKIKSQFEAGGLVAESNGYISHCSVSGTVIGSHGHYSGVGGLVGGNGGTISDSFSTAAVTGTFSSYAGGLVGASDSSGNAVVQMSFATGSVTAVKYGKQHGTDVGGLIGENLGTVVSSYASGRATGGQQSLVGGLAGATQSTISTSYSTGKVQGQPYLGGFVGYDNSGGSLSENYWDTQTSGVSNSSQGAGYPLNDPGITGLTSKQLKSGLPLGFDPAIWGQSSKINKGFPYLLANPPP